MPHDGAGARPYKTTETTHMGSKDDAKTKVVDPFAPQGLISEPAR